MSQPSYLHKYKMVEDVKPGGTFLLNCSWSDDQLDEKLPDNVKRFIAQNNIKFYTCDAVSIARSLGLRGRTNTVFAGCFL